MIVLSLRTAPVALLLVGGPEPLSLLVCFKIESDARKLKSSEALSSGEKIS